MTPTEDLQQTESVAAPIGLPGGNLLLRVCRNAAAHLTGRNLISLGRLVVASSIARSYGKTIFGQYSLLIVMLSIAEWVLDFGTSDVFVREICRAPERGARLVRMLTAAKLLQIVAASGGFLAVIFALGYPAEMMRAALFGAVSLAFFGGVLIYHTLFKATLTMEREVAAEFVSVIVMICLVRLAARHTATIPMIFACHMASRAVFFVLSYAFGRPLSKLSLQSVSWPDLQWTWRASAAIGVIGLVVVVYESMDLLLLGRFGSLSDVAYYSGAQRFISPVLVALAGIGGTLYPVVASYWPLAFADFENSCQRAMEAAFAAVGLAICMIVAMAGADFLMRLIGPDLAPGAAILKVLAIVLFVKAISNTLGPVLYVVQAQNSALRLVMTALVVKAGLIAVLAPRFGYIGVAVSAVLTDSATAAVTMFLLRKASGFQMRWTVPVKVVLITLASAFVPQLLVPAGGVLAAIAAAALFVPLVFLSGSVRLCEVISLLRWKTA